MRFFATLLAAFLAVGSACAGSADRAARPACPPGHRCFDGEARGGEAAAPAPRRDPEARLDGLPLVAIPRSAPRVGQLRGRGSLSVGSPTTGFVVGCRPMPLEGPHHAVLAEHAARGTACATDDLVDALQRAAARVSEARPGARLGVGNLGRPGGGDIPWSVSHNSGRDADLAFYLLGPDGKPLLPRTLVRLDGAGRGEADGVPVRFDVPRNWLLVKALLEDRSIQVNWIFVSRSLKRALLGHARARREKADLLRRAEEALAQPRRSRPHDDHLHLRISCPDDDLYEGCRDIGTQRSWFRDPGPRVAARLRELLPLARRGEGAARGEALTVLGRLGIPESLAEVAAHLEDPDPAVRRAAAAALAEGGVEGVEGRVVERLARGGDDAVTASLVAALERHLHPWRRPAALGALLASPASWEVDLGVARVRRPVREWAAQALARQSVATAARWLVEALAAERMPAQEAARALGEVTGVPRADGAAGDRADAWRDWWRERQGRPAREWIAESLRARQVDPEDPGAARRLADVLEKGGSRDGGAWLREAALLLDVRLAPDGISSWSSLLREAATGPAPEEPPADEGGNGPAGEPGGAGKGN